MTSDRFLIRDNVYFWSANTFSKQCRFCHSCTREYRQTEAFFFYQTHPLIITKYLTPEPHLHVQLHSRTNSTTRVPFLFCNSCELSSRCEVAGKLLFKRRWPSGRFQAAIGSWIISHWQQMCSCLKIIEEVLILHPQWHAALQSFSHRIKEDLCDQSHLFATASFFWWHPTHHLWVISAIRAVRLVTSCCCGCDSSAPFPVGEMPHVFSFSFLSFAGCFSFSALSSALYCLTLSTPVRKGSVCVCLRRQGICVGLS